MSERPKRRLLDRLGSSPTLISEGSRIVGDIETRGPLVLSGALEGNGRIGGALSIASGAEWRGDVSAEDAVIAGRVVGNLVIAGKIEVGSTAVIEGGLSARVIAIANGAVVHGDVTVTSGDPVVRFEDRRAAGHAPADD